MTSDEKVDKKEESSRLSKGNCGVVGYHVRFTRERPPVRTRAVAFFSLSTSYTDLSALDQKN